jgi:hypothetical protein
MTEGEKDEVAEDVAREVGDVACRLYSEPGWTMPWGSLLIDDGDVSYRVVVYAMAMLAAGLVPSSLTTVDALCQDDGAVDRALKLGWMRVSIARDTEDCRPDEWNYTRALVRGLLEQGPKLVDEFNRRVTAN